MTDLTMKNPIVRVAQWFQDLAEKRVCMGGSAVHGAVLFSVAVQQEDREWSVSAVKTIARGAICTESTARLALVELVKAGWLRRSDIPLGPNGYQTRFAVADVPGGFIAPRQPPKPARAGNGKQRKGSTRAAVFARDGHACRYCGSPEHLVLDHVIPRCQKGTNDRENLVAACWGCNSKKRGRTPEQAGMVLRPTMVREAAPPVVIDSATAPPVFRAIAALAAARPAAERVDIRFRNTKAHMMPATARLVLRTLAGRADDADRCHPSMRTLANDCGVSEPTARAALRALVANSWLVVSDANRCGPDGERAANEYTLTPERGEWWPDDAREHLARRPPVRGAA